MLEVWDYFNIIGILLEITGFILLLEKIKNWFQTKLNYEYLNLADNYKDASNEGRFYAEELNEKLRKFNSTVEQKKTRKYRNSFSHNRFNWSIIGCFY